LRMKKSITSIPKKTMDVLSGLDWPGNVRELENIIERAVILTQGSVLLVPLGEIMAIPEERIRGQTLEAVERDHIVRALQQSHGQIGGMSGAAGRLGMNRTTLQSKMKHLGIDPRPGRPRSVGLRCLDLSPHRRAQLDSDFQPLRPSIRGFDS
jgi:formate hydrogenlyase transcriptional activator